MGAPNTKPDQPEGTPASDDSENTYATIVAEILKTEPAAPSDKDSDAVVAALVEELKKKPGYVAGSSEEPLFAQARSMYYDYRDKKRAAERAKKTGQTVDGAAESLGCCPSDY